MEILWGVYMLKKEDYEDINSLIAISSQINDIYDELYLLELDNQKGTKIYQKVLEKLKTSIFVENNIYERIGTSYDKTLDILNYLSENGVELQQFAEEIPIFSSNLVVSRILNRFVSNITISQDILPQDLKLMLEKDGVAYHEVTDSFTASMKVKNSITNDLINCLLAILEKEPNKNVDINNNLKKTKYMVSYLYQNIENNLIKNNFQIELNPYVETIIIAQMSNWPKEIIKKIKTLYGLEYYETIVKSMLLYDDEDLENEKIMTKMIINQAFLRTVFLLLDDGMIMDLNSDFHDLIEKDDLQEIFKTREKTIEIIINAYRKVKQDKGIPKIISLKL